MYGIFAYIYHKNPKSTKCVCKYTYPMDPMVDSNGSFLVNIWYMYGIHGSYEDRRSDSFHSNFRTHLGFALHPMGNIVHHSTHHHLQEGFFWDVFQGTLESNLRKLNFRSFRCSEIPQEVQVVDPKYFSPWPKVTS